MPQLTWLVTGCSSGLGLTFIQQILARGDKAIATTRGPVSRISSLADLGAKTYSLDVTAPEDEVNAVIAKILKEEKHIDVLVNNAGYVEVGLVEEMTIERYRAQFDTNFFGVVKTTQAVLPHFREKNSGTIVIVSSLLAFAGIPGGGAYCGTKYALEGWHECLKLEVAQFNIRSIIFEVGYFRTPVLGSENLKLAENHVSDYDEMRKGLAEFLHGADGNQPGDPEKGIKVMIDVIKGEGVAEGKKWTERLPLGPDALDAMRNASDGYLAICNEWKDVVSSTNFE